MQNPIGRSAIARPAHITGSGITTSIVIPRPSDHATSNTSTLVGSESSVSSSSTRMNGAGDHGEAPFAVRNGRRYLRDAKLPYPLPCDTSELHRQILRTSLLVEIFGTPLCSAGVSEKPPKRILEIACGTGIWSSLCHDQFVRSGHKNISFTGIDIAPIAPDLNEHGMNWHFVQHDIRRLPFPFADEEFDMVFVKDLSLVTPNTGFQERLMTEYLRILRPGGVIEAWDSDHVLRTLETLPAVHDVPKKLKEQVDKTATYHLQPGTSFSAAQNPYLKDYNDWLQKTLEHRRLSSCPCTIIGPLFLQEVDLEVVGSRRIAILFSEVRWEREGVGGNHNKAGKRGTKTRQTERKRVNASQMALRRAALLTVVQMIESLEPLLKQVSGKSQEEWDHWWSSMMEDLLENNGASSGECLEVGAWWGRKC